MFYTVFVVVVFQQTGNLFELFWAIFVIAF